MFMCMAAGAGGGIWGGGDFFKTLSMSLQVADTHTRQDDALVNKLHLAREVFTM